MNQASTTARNPSADAPASKTGRGRLDRERILSAAVDLADSIGVEPLTIRRLAERLGTRPMSLYHHVSNKEAILDGMVDQVFAEMVLPDPDLGWKEAMRARCVSAREVLRRHPWATPLLESRRAPGPATLRHHDAVIGCLRGGGLSVGMTAHAYAVLDSFVYGFALQEAGLSFSDGAELAAFAESLLASIPADKYPNLRELTREHILQPGYSFGHSFDFGLATILDALELAIPSPP